MKKIFFVLCLVTGLASCSSSDQGSSPTAAIDAMFTAMKSGNMEDIKKFITKRDVAFLESAEKLATSIDPEAIKKIKDEMSDNFKSKVKDVTYTLKN
ncbi:MAG: lipoprotein [Ferruginibacter sp.]